MAVDAGPIQSASTASTDPAQEDRVGDGWVFARARGDRTRSEPGHAVSRRGILGAGAGLCGLASVSGWSSAALAETLATGFRIGLHSSRTRVVLDLSGQPAYRLFTLVDPPRLVIDLQDADWLVPAGALPSSAGHVQGVRHGLLDDGLTRVVLDLDGPARVQEAFVLSPREDRDWRLVIDLTDTTAAAFRGTAGVERAIQPRRTAPAAPDSTMSATVGLRPDTVDAVRETEIPPLPSILAPRGALVPPNRPAVSSALTASDSAPPVPPPLIRPSFVQPPLASISRSQTPGAFIPVPGHKPTLPRKPIIALDPGHGGKDPGAISLNGVYEKDIVLSMGKELRQALIGTGRYRVFMTRESDVSVHLRERVRRARQAEADLFVSIHADAIRNPSVRGLSVYTLSEKASDAEAAALADRENKADIILGMDFSAESPDVTNILIDLAQRETMNRSVRFANTLLTELPQEVRTLNHSRRYAGFAVLKAPDVPSALLEMGYLSNHTEEKLLRQRAYRAKLVHAVVRSLDRFFSVVQGAQRP